MSLYARPIEFGDSALLPGEVVEGSANDVTYLCPINGPQPGILYVTTYKFSFITSNVEPLRKYNVPVGFIHSVEKMGGVSSKGEHSYGLEVQLKEFHSYRFAFKQEGHSRRELYEVLMRIAFPLNCSRHMFAYAYFAEMPPERQVAEVENWSALDMRQDLERLGVPGDRWRVTMANESYNLCSTYPSLLAVPASVGDAQLQEVAAFRSRSRFPTLSWLHPENGNSLCRSAQPLAGKFGKRSKEDEAYLAAIQRANPSSQKLVVMDARPKLNAMANKAMGGGYEDEEHYGDMELMFLDIGNIHVMRDSLRKLRDVCSLGGDEARWMSSLENSRWLEHIRLIMGAALRVVDLMDRCRSSVLVHCSDGWDRTSQICALAMLLMDPHYRTIAGFAGLVEKEWLAFGFKFQQRCGHGDRHSGDEQRAPIFVQFVDAVWQVMRQFPNAFEFNEQYLLTILHQLHSCLYGTFLCNSERERRSVKSKTMSLWSQIEQDRPKYRNPLYAAYMHSQSLYPVASVRRLQFWASYYTRWQPRVNPAQPEGLSAATELHQVCLALEGQCMAMQSQIDQQQAEEMQRDAAAAAD